MKILPDVLRFRLLRRKKKQHAASSASNSAAATTEPMTMPAIAPLDRPLLSSAAAGALVSDDDGPPSDVEVGNNVGLRVNCGKTTS